MQTVDENTIVEIGKFYLVQCARIIIKGRSKVMLVPIIGEAHKDAQFGFQHKHHHIDGRFYSSEYFSIDSEGKTNAVVIIDDANHYDFAGIEIKKKKCIRLTTGIAPPKRGFQVGLGFEPGKRYWDWVDSMIGKSCQGKKCPHLGHSMKEENGVLICPLHNLKGCSVTEKIIG